MGETGNTAQLRSSDRCLLLPRRVQTRGSRCWGKLSPVLARRCSASAGGGQLISSSGEPAPYGGSAKLHQQSACQVWPCPLLSLDPQHFSWTSSKDIPVCQCEGNSIFADVVILKSTGVDLFLSTPGLLAVGHFPVGTPEEATAGRWLFSPNFQTLCRVKRSQMHTIGRARACDMLNIITGPIFEPTVNQVKLAPSLSMWHGHGAPSQL